MKGGSNESTPKRGLLLLQEPDEPKRKKGKEPKSRRSRGWRNEASRPRFHFSKE
jgi:hypothetical protein